MSKQVAAGVVDALLQINMKVQRGTFLRVLASIWGPLCPSTFIWGRVDDPHLGVAMGSCASGHLPAWLTWTGSCFCTLGLLFLAGLGIRALWAVLLGPLSFGNSHLEGLESELSPPQPSSFGTASAPGLGPAQDAGPRWDFFPRLRLGLMRKGFQAGSPR